MLNLQICPVCGKKLLKDSKAYICENSKCEVCIIDNHIFEMSTFMKLFSTDKSEKEEHKVKRVEVHSKQAIEQYCMERHSEISVVISISSIKTNPAFIVRNNVSNIADILRLEFNDTDSAEMAYGGITAKEAKQIADFVRKYENDESIDKIIIQCEAGQSRSSGVAGAIMKYLFNDDSAIFNNKRYTPNMLCYRKVLNELFR